MVDTNRPTSVILTAAGARERVLEGSAGTVYPVEKWTQVPGGQLMAHVRREPRGERWSLGERHYVPAIVFTLPGAAGEALEVDQVPDFVRGSARVVNKSFCYTCARRGRGWSYVVTCSPDVARYLLREAQDRANSPRLGAGEGYDQPDGWKYACRVAADRIRKALTAAGEVV